MTDREINALIEKHDRYRLEGVTFPYKDHLKLFDALLSRHKYNEAQKIITPDKLEFAIFKS